MNALRGMASAPLRLSALRKRCNDFPSKTTASTRYAIAGTQLEELGQAEVGQPR
jgi:hypothetical protein